MVLTALRGAVGFLTRLPAGNDEQSWRAFRANPSTLPAIGYLIGMLGGVPFVLAGGIDVIAGAILPPSVVAFAYLIVIYGVTGITHADGLADLGDAAVVHGEQERRRAVMRDTTTGVGAIVALGLGLIGITLVALSIAGLPVRAAVAIVVAGEVAAKLGMAAAICSGQTGHEGLAAELVSRGGPRQLAGAAIVSLPAGLLAWPSPATWATLIGGLVGAAVIVRWARRALGGISGDVLGAVNEISRIVALHAGVVAWTLS